MQVCGIQCHFVKNISIACQKIYTLYITKENYLEEPLLRY